MAHDALYPYACNETWVHNLYSTVDTNTPGTFYTWILVPRYPFDIEYYKESHPSGYAGQWYFRMAVGGTATYAVATNRDWGIPNRFGGPDAVLVTHSCGNFTVYFVEGYTERTQTSALEAAIASDRSKSSALRCAIALPKDTATDLYAAIEKVQSINCQPKAAVEGWTSISSRMKASIQDDISLSTELYAAVADEFGTTLELYALIQKPWRLRLPIKAAVQGNATRKQCALKAYVIKSRKDQIRIEFEPRLPQEFAQVSVPNWPSTFFDSRERVIGQ